MGANYTLWLAAVAFLKASFGLYFSDIAIKMRQKIKRGNGLLSGVVSEKY